MNGHPRHPGLTELAEFRAGVTDAADGERLAAHLAECPDCAAVGDRLDQIPALLASVPAPAMPEDVAARILAALAVASPVEAEDGSAPVEAGNRSSTSAEAGNRSSSAGARQGSSPAWAGHRPSRGRSFLGRSSPGRSSPGRSSPGRSSQDSSSPGHSSPGHFPLGRSSQDHSSQDRPSLGRSPRERAPGRGRLRSPATVSLGGLAAAAACVGLAFLGLRLSGPDHPAASVSPTGGPGGGTMHARPNVPASEAPSLHPGGIGPAAGRPPFTVTVASTNFLPSTLRDQVLALLPGASASSLRTPSGPLPSPTVVGCVTRILGPATPLVVERAKYESRPAYVIAESSHAWVVASGCTASDPEILASVSLPRVPGG
ncbi:MAG: hypothetical protein J2P26_01485 [Nocardiopsaceae bacterium]|nr:hypothetical protein [Nocardiopsaceae bacterium]